MNPIDHPADKAIFQLRPTFPQQTQTNELLEPYSIKEQWEKDAAMKSWEKNNLPEDG